jgi:acyl carrier protein
VSDASVLDRVMRIIVSVAGPSRTPPGAGPDTPLWTDGFWLDSIALLQIAVACEAEFGFDPTSEIPPDAPVTARALAALVESAQRRGRLGGSG